MYTHENAGCSGNKTGGQTMFYYYYYYYYLYLFYLHFCVGNMNIIHCVIVNMNSNTFDVWFAITSTII